MGSIGALKVHLLRCKLSLSSNLLRGPRLLPRLGLLVIDGKELALGIGCMSSIRALKVHLLSSKLVLSSKLLGGPRLLPRLGLLSVAGSRCSRGHFAVNFGRRSCLRSDYTDIDTRYSRQLLLMRWMLELSKVVENLSFICMFSSFLLPPYSTLCVFQKGQDGCAKGSRV